MERGTMSPDLRGMVEVCCPDCGTPILASPVDHTLNSFTIDDCRCERERYDLPAVIALFGPVSGPLSFFGPKAG